jgi:hypothetical protein
LTLSAIGLVLAMVSVTAMVTCASIPSFYRSGNRRWRRERSAAQRRMAGHLYGRRAHASRAKLVFDD